MMCEHERLRTLVGRTSSCRCVALWNSQAWPLVVPRHRADLPAAGRHDELRRDHATSRKGIAVLHARLGVRAKAVRNIPEYLHDRGQLDFVEGRQLPRRDQLRTRLDKLPDRRDLRRC